uniref:Uncharacterized protein n=1 Tax=Arundo donax TaxID=35708 RepID=A0A0A9F9D9_ARUDO
MLIEKYRKRITLLILSKM